MVKRGDGSVSWLFYAFFFSDAVQAEEQVSYRNKCYGKNADPHQNAGYALGFQVYKEVGIDQRGGCGGYQNGSVELQNDCLNQEEDNVSKGECGGSEGIIPLSLFPLIEQKPVNNVQNGKRNMENQAAHTPVCLGITAFRTGQHDVEYQEGQQNAKHTDELEDRHSRNIAVFVLLCCLDQRGKHHTEAQEIADVGEVYVEIPANGIDVVEDSETCDTANKSQRAVDGLKNQLDSSVFNHNNPPYSLPGCRAAWRFTIFDVSR